MKNIQRHPFPEDLVDEFTERARNAIESSFEKLRSGNPRVVSSLADEGFRHAGCVALREPQSPEVCRGLQITASASVALFDLARQDSGEVDVRILGVAQRFAATGVTSMTSAGRWWVGFCCAAIVRDHAALDSLASFPVARLASSSTKSLDCVFREAETMQALWLRRPEFSSLLVRAVEATEPKPDWSRDETDFALDLTLQELELIAKAASGDAAGYADKLVFALQRHKHYWSKAARARNAMGFLALGLLGVDSLVREGYGLNATVESDYFPMAIATGGCAG
jgi:hypothetical protein